MTRTIRILTNRWTHRSWNDNLTYTVGKREVGKRIIVHGCTSTQSSSYTPSEPRRRRVLADYLTAIDLKKLRP